MAKSDEQIIREVFERLSRAEMEAERARGGMRWTAEGDVPQVSLADLRRALVARRNPGQTTWSRERQDAALDSLGLQDGVHLRGELYQRFLTDADHAAAIRLGGDDRHNLLIEPEYWSAPPPPPPPSSAVAPAPAPAAASSSSSHAEAAEITVFADLQEPDIDPYEYAVQLPAQFAQVSALLRLEEKELADHAECVRGKAACLRAYVDYMIDAQVDVDVLTKLESAHEVYEAIAAALSAQAEEAREAAYWMDNAQQAAEQVYGDDEVPRFDRAG